MGYFKYINFSHYRNFEKSSFVFAEGCNILYGKNGSGKTNILEGLSLFEKGRGFRKEKINNFLKFDSKESNFNIQSIFINEKNEYKINVFNTDKNLKKISVNNSIEIESIKHFESLFSIIYFLPEMERLFVTSSSNRRNFLDRLIFTFNKSYNYIINNYKKSVQERQLLLKSQKYDESWINKLENNICRFGLEIYKYRFEHINNINKILKNLDIVKDISSNFFLKIDDKFLENYPNAYNEQEIFLNELKKNRKIDFFAGGCSIGPHRSDLSGFNVDNLFNINQYSTGQQKTAILLIIIVQCKYLIDNLQLKPIILLDEVCSHLDNVNRELLLYLIDNLAAQVFMTGTEENFFSFLSTKANYCNIT